MWEIQVHNSVAYNYIYANYYSVIMVVNIDCCYLHAIIELPQGVVFDQSHKPVKFHLLIIIYFRF